MCHISCFTWSVRLLERATHLHRRVPVLRSNTSYYCGYKNMNKTTALATLAGVLVGSQIALAGDITGTVTLKGTPPKEKDITPLKEDANCGKLHSEMPTTHFYVVGP